jgi:cellulose synthase/poly-beta-1,6-N-acetylglucosamine synthase-like glycosyltransferase
LGLQNARERALSEARYSFVGFVDDDNWVAPDWVSNAYHILSSDLGLGALGSICTPAFEVPAPAWFDKFHSTYAIFTEAEFDQTQEPPKYLPGAGLCLRKAAWEELARQGFKCRLMDRKGKKLSGGGDAEVTTALRLSGWKLRVDKRLKLQHFMPRERLNWTYFRALRRGYGSSQVLLDAYSSHSLELKPGFRRWLSDQWWYQFLRSVGRLIGPTRTMITALSSEGEGRKDIAEIETQFGRALGLLAFRNEYSCLRSEIREVKWRSLQAKSVHLTGTDPITDISDTGVVTHLNKTRI